MNIYVGNLPKTVTEDSIREKFAQFGEVTEVKIIKDHLTGELRGFAFVEMPSKTDAESAIQSMNGAEMDGSKLVVNQARPRKDRPGGGGSRQRSGGGGGYRGGSRSRSW